MAEDAAVAPEGGGWAEPQGRYQPVAFRGWLREWAGGVYFTSARQQCTGSSNAGPGNAQPGPHSCAGVPPDCSLPGRLGVVPRQLLGQPQQHCLVCSTERRHPVSPLIPHKRRHRRDCSSKGVGEGGGWCEQSHVAGGAGPISGRAGQAPACRCWRQQSLPAQLPTHLSFPSPLGAGPAAGRGG